MGNDLMHIPVFAQTIARCDAVLRPRGIDIYEILTTDDTTIFDNIVNSFVAIISMQVYKRNKIFRKKKHSFFFVFNHR